MTMLEIIDKKKNSKELSYEEIKYVVNGYVAGDIPDYQMSAFLMTIVFNGMTFEEVYSLTKVMKESGDVMDLSDLGKIVDKHSTGGVGDKTTMIIGPIVAASGVKVAKMSGRGLGHTGGTIDKLESIPGFNVTMSLEQFRKQVLEHSIAVVSQMGNLVPADKKIYALRDVTGTVDSLPLIASSIMSKKLASGASSIVIDLKVGEGALVKDIEQARTLARYMVELGKKEDKKVICVLSNMSEPLGYTIGNALEVKEAMDMLENKDVPNDLYELCITLASYMISLGKDISLEEARKEAVSNLESGKAYEKFLDFVHVQGGDIKKITYAPKVFSIKSRCDGFVSNIHTLRLGELARKIGAGRYSKEDTIDFGVGFELRKKVGDFVYKDEELVRVYLNQKDVGVNEILDCFEIADTYHKEPLIYEVIDK